MRTLLSVYTKLTYMRCVGKCFWVAEASLLYVNPALSWTHSGRHLYISGTHARARTHTRM